MGKRRISVEGLTAADANITAQVVVWEEQEVEGNKVEASIGERFLTFPPDATAESMIPAIKRAAEEVEAMVEKAKDMREQVNVLLSKEKIK